MSTHSQKKVIDMVRFAHFRTYLRGMARTCAIVCLLLLPDPSFAQPASTGVISGIVLDATSGNATARRHRVHSRHLADGGNGTRRSVSARRCTGGSPDARRRLPGPRARRPAS